MTGVGIGETPLECAPRWKMLSYQKKSKPQRKSQRQIFNYIKSSSPVSVLQFVSVVVSPYLSPVCTCTPRHPQHPFHLPPLRGRQRISLYFPTPRRFSLATAVRSFLLPTFNYLQSFHILNLLACCLCSDFSAAIFLFLRSFFVFLRAGFLECRTQFNSGSKM